MLGLFLTQYKQFAEVYISNGILHMLAIKRSSGGDFCSKKH